MNSIIKNPNIIFLFINNFFKSFTIMIPILVLYFEDRGLSMTQIMILQTVFSVVIVLLEIPSGYLADLFKRKYLIIIGALFSFLGSCFYYFFGNFVGLLFAEILLGVGISFKSGSDTAYLYDELKEKGKEKEYQKVEGKYTALSSFSEGIASFITGFFVIFSYKFIILLQTILAFLGFLSSLFLKEHKKNIKNEEKIKIKEIIKFITKENYYIKYLIIFSGVIMTSTLTYVFLSQSLWKELGLKDTYFGIVWGVLNLLVSVSAIFAFKLRKILSLKKIFILFGILSFIFYLLLGLTKNIYLVLIISSGFWIFRGLYNPIINNVINENISSNMRATVLSINSFVFRGIFSIISPFIGYFNDIYNFQTSLIISSFVFFVLSLISLIFLFFNWKK